MRCTHQKYFPFAEGEVFDVIRVNMVNVSLFFYLMNIPCHDLFSARFPCGSNSKFIFPKEVLKEESCKGAYQQ
jgi:hypothetical protein